MPSPQSTLPTSLAGASGVHGCSAGQLGLDDETSERLAYPAACGWTRWTYYLQRITRTDPSCLNRFAAGYSARGSRGAWYLNPAAQVLLLLCLQRAVAPASRP